MSGGTESVWYDVGDPDRLHADLRADYARAAAAVARRPALAAAHRDCAPCAAIRASVNAPTVGRRRRIKIVLRPSQLHQLLGLPPSHQVVFVYSTPDPNAVMVLVEGDDLPETAESDPTPPAPFA
ncbi:hypothetical protein [Actinoplanes sp. NPDC026623]|uniref:hypothetical protein n=1 Tax=Actinoplanes sp. NPDC026623 TaxID=3155610 RepID=UPI00340E94BD